MARTANMKLSSGNGLLLALAVVAGLIAAVIVFVVVSESGDDGGSPAVAEPVTALVATQSISPGTEITADMVEVREVPADLALAGVYDDSELVIGEVARVQIASGEQVTRSKIGLLVPDDGLSGVVQPGMRGVSVSVDEVTSVGGNLLPGDHVDIIVSQRIERAPGLAEDEFILRTFTVLQDVEVLAVAQEAQLPAGQTRPSEEGEEGDAPNYISGQIPDDPERQPNAATLTLALTPAEALLLVAETQSAVRTYALLRAFGDTSIIESEPIETIMVE